MKVEELRRGMIFNYRFDDVTSKCLLIDYEKIQKVKKINDVYEEYDEYIITFTDVIGLEEVEFSPRTEEEDPKTNCSVYDEIFDETRVLSI